VSRFAPVQLSRPLERRASQTFLRHMSRCPRSAWLYHEHKGDVQNDAMARGTAFHVLAERVVKLAIENGEPMVPPELVRDVLTEVLAEYPVPFEEHDFLREMSWRWSSEWTIDPKQVVACETLFVLKVGGWEVRAKVDFAELRGQTLYVADYKSGRGAFSYDDIARKRSDGSFLPRTFQLVLYALAVKYGVPVRREKCPACDGHDLSEWEGPCEHDCRHGYIEVAEEARGARAQDVIAEYIYPAIENAEGRMLRRETSLTSMELTESLESLKALIDRLAASERSGDWPAIVSTAACNECPSPSECPIPVELRDHAGEIRTVEQAAEALERLERRREDDAKVRREIKALAKELDVEIRFGADKAARFVYSKVEKLDKKKVLAAVAAGAPLTRDEAFASVESTNFVDVKLTEDELADQPKETQ
jgi:hypothetical protein